MSSKLNPYLSFKGNAREALSFYESVFGGKVDISTYGEFKGDMPMDEGEVDKVMHGVLEADNGILFMVADTPSGTEHQTGSSISMSLSGDNEEELYGYFNKLVEGGQVTLPLEQAPWGDKFGMLVDKFGISWMVNIAGPKAD